MDMSMINKLQEIERAAYPEEYRQMQHFTDVDDLVDYCEADDIDDVVVLTGNNWYLIAVKSTHEVVDLASDGGMEMRDLIRVWAKIKSELNGRAILDAREGTSYRLIKSLETRGSLKIESDRSYDWADETFHDLTITWT